MTPGTDEPGSSLFYELDCIDCPFEAVVEGDISDVLEAIDVHQEQTKDQFEHFVEFESRETRSGLTSVSSPDSDDE